MDNRKYNSLIESTGEPPPYIVGNPDIREDCTVVVEFSDDLHRVIGVCFYDEGKWIFEPYSEYLHIFGSDRFSIHGDLESGRAKIKDIVTTLCNNYNLDMYEIEKNG